jgi:hypothetical protein
MTRKDYTALAATFNRIHEQIVLGRTDNAFDAFVESVNAVADAMQRENGRFDRARFMAACGF